MSSQILMLLWVGVCETAVALFALKRLLGPRKPNTDAGMTAFGCIYFFACVFDSAAGFDVYVVFSVAYALLIAATLLLWDGSVIRRLVVPFCCLSADYAFSILSELAEWAFRGHGSFSHNLQATPFTQTAIVLSCCAWILVPERIGERGASGQEGPIALVLPLALLGLSIAQFYLNQEPLTAGTLAAGQAVVACLLLDASALTWAVTSANTALSSALAESATLQQMLALQESHYADVRERRLAARRLAHDLKSHSRTMLALLEHGDETRLRSYIVGLQGALAPLSAPVVECDHHAIGALINDRLGAARAAGAKVSACVMVPSELSVSDVDVSVVLGNLLDNAVEACAAMKAGQARRISVDIRMHGDFLRFEVANTYGAEPVERAGRYVSTKADPEAHGVGLTNVDRLVSRHRGRLMLSHEKGTFRAVAVLNVAL